MITFYQKKNVDVSCVSPAYDSHKMSRHISLKKKKKKKKKKKWRISSATNLYDTEKEMIRNHGKHSVLTVSRPFLRKDVFYKEKTCS